jgi:transposase
VNVSLTDSERQQLRQLQKHRREEAGYVKVTGVLMLDAGRAVATVAQDLGLDDGTVYGYAEAFARLGLAKYLTHEQRSYWGLLTSAQLAGLCRELRQTLYTDCRALPAWVAQAYGARYSISGLTDLLHRLGFAYKLTTPVPCQADAERPATFLTEQLQPLLAQAEAGQADKPLGQVFLPPYSPNLNLIERLWKFLRQKIINATFYRTKGQFRQAVLGFFHRLHRLDEFGHELASLFSLNFHLIDSQPTS